MALKSKGFLRAQKCHKRAAVPLASGDNPNGGNMAGREERTDPPFNMGKGANIVQAAEARKQSMGQPTRGSTQHKMGHPHRTKPRERATG